MVFNKQLLNNLLILLSDILQCVLDIGEVLSVRSGRHHYSLHTIRDRLVQLVLDLLLLLFRLAVNDSLMVFRNDVGKVDGLSILPVTLFDHLYHAIHLVTTSRESPHQMQILVLWH